MTTNPFYNALFAIAYIAVLVTLIFFGPQIVAGQRDGVFIPMGMLGLLVFSVALMAYLFFYRPVLMLLDGERERAVKLFLHTIGIFAGAILIVFLISIIVSR